MAKMDSLISLSKLSALQVVQGKVLERAFLWKAKVASLDSFLSVQQLKQKRNFIPSVMVLTASPVEDKGKIIISGKPLLHKDREQYVIRSPQGYYSTIEVDTKEKELLCAEIDQYESKFEKEKLVEETMKHLQGFQPSKHIFEGYFPYFDSLHQNQDGMQPQLNFKARCVFVLFKDNIQEFIMLKITSKPPPPEISQKRFAIELKPEWFKVKFPKRSWAIVTQIIGTNEKLPINVGTHGFLADKKRPIEEGNIVQFSDQGVNAFFQEILVEIKNAIINNYLDAVCPFSWLFDDDGDDDEIQSETTFLEKLEQIVLEHHKMFRELEEDSPNDDW